MFTTDDIRKTTSKFDEILSKRPRPRDPSASPKAYQNISVVKKLSQGKFPIYLTSSKTNNQNYAMKVFYHMQEGSNAYYKNEVRFASLKHPNVIEMVSYENEKETFHKGELKKASYILMEYAPYGDFFDFISKYNSQFDEKLVRTYFRQLVDGVEYLHSNNIAHLDLKPENLLVGADFNLKIADFDMSHVYGDKRILSRGTRYYRAPEFFNTAQSSVVALDQPFTADIYSAGIILFIMKTGGIYPHAENDMFDGVSFADLMDKDNRRFWAEHCKIQSRAEFFFSQEFKNLFNGMVKLNPKERMTIKQIRESKWYNGAVYTPRELKDKMEKIMKC